MCASGANERNENGLTGVGAASNWHLRGGKNGDGSKGDPSSYDGFDLVKMGAVKSDKLGSSTASKKLGRNAPTVGTAPKKTVLTGA